jgi:hypothetical protein
MALKDLLPELLQLNRDEMIQAVEILKRQLDSTMEEPSGETIVYEVWSPTITLEAARILQEVLDEDQAAHE